MDSKKANSVALSAGSVGLVGCLMPFYRNDSMLEYALDGNDGAIELFIALIIILVVAIKAKGANNFSKKHAAIVALASLYILKDFDEPLDFFEDAAIGGKLILVSLFLALISAIIGLLKGSSGSVARKPSAKKGLDSLFSLLGVLPIPGMSKGSRGGAVVVSNSGVPKRFKMLRHSRFIQFPRLNFGTNLSPHKMHWTIEEALEDQGVSNVKPIGPVCTSYWTKVVPGENGLVANVADYIPFEGGFTGNRGEAVPSWVRLAIFGAGALFLLGGAAGVVALSILGILGAAGLSIFAWYWKTYRCGSITMLYRGMYTTAEDESADLNDWRFSVDMMFSVDVKKPLFGTAIGSEVVAPIYAYVEESLRNDLTTTKGQRTLPELVTRKPSELEKRFPVTEQKAGEQL